MITPDEFPYITALHVNDCYTYKDFDIQLHDYKPFSHLILTGKNGSGKSTILRSISDRVLINNIGNANLVQVYFKHFENNDLATYHRFSPINNYNEGLVAFFQAKRESRFNPVSTPTRLDQFYSHHVESSQFLQYLVNKKIDQVFNLLEGKTDSVETIDNFFNRIENTLKTVFHDNVSLEFVKDSYSFLIHLSDGRAVTFNELPEGFSAFTNVLLDLLIRTDLIRRQAENYAYNPCGVVLIDEPETHLHLELQEQVLPLLTELFPNIQFICATHSPAVIASIKNATIFDLTTKETRLSEEAVGRSYSELTTSHFGLENDYSTIADEYVHQIDELLDTYGSQPAELIQHLESWKRENAQFLSPTLQIKLDFIIAQQNAKLAVAQ